MTPDSASTVLFIEDSRDVANLVAEMFTQKGIECIVAPTAQQALAHILNEGMGIDGILINKRFPEKPNNDAVEAGIPFIRSLRTNTKLQASLPNLKVLIGVSFNYTDPTFQNVISTTGKHFQEKLKVPNFYYKAIEPGKIAKIIPEIQAVLNQK